MLTLHDEKRGAVLVADVVERADVRVIERGDRAGFILEPRAEVWLGRQRRREHLDRHDAVEPGIAGPIHLAHAAGSHQRLQQVGSQARARGKWH